MLTVNIRLFDHSDAKTLLDLSISAARIILCFG